MFRPALTRGTAMRAAVLLACASIAPACVAVSQDLQAPSPDALARTWQAERLPLPPPPLVTHAVVEAQVGRLVRESGGTVVADATFLTPESRESIAAVAARAGVSFAGVWLECPPEVMAERLRQRASDASDATVEVLQRQLERDPGPVAWNRYDTDGDPASLAARIADTLSAVRKCRTV